LSLVKSTLEETETMTIGELAKKVGTTTRTIRYYEELGVLQNLRRGTNGYRQYTAGHITAMRLIKRAKRLGFSLEEIRELFEIYRNNPETEANLIKRSIEVLKLHISDGEKKRDELDAYLAMLKIEIKRLKGLLKGKDPQPTLSLIIERTKSKEK